MESKHEHHSMLVFPCACGERYGTEEGISYDLGLGQEFYMKQFNEWLAEKSLSLDNIQEIIDHKDLDELCDNEKEMYCCAKCDDKWFGGAAEDHMAIFCSECSLEDAELTHQDSNFMYFECKCGQKYHIAYSEIHFDEGIAVENYLKKFFAKELEQQKANL